MSQTKPDTMISPFAGVDRLSRLSAARSRTSGDRASGATVSRPALAAALAAAGLAVMPAESRASDAIRLQPHRAIYDLTLARSASGSGLSEMNGRLVYELTGAPCEGYTQNMRFVTRSTTSDGSEQVNDIRTSSFEEAAGEKLDFSTTHHHDSRTEVTEGRAARKAATASGGGIKVDIAKPEARQLSLPATVYFPIQHSIALIGAAERGERRFAADLYDGSEKGDKVSATTTIIGEKAVAAQADLPESASAMVGMTYWPIASSYFEKSKSFGRVDAVPNYEMQARFFRNGVSTRLTLDYGDFALKGDLKEIKLLPDASCVTNK
jgi:hypothetical protein